jgi:hypothetical protein
MRKYNSTDLAATGCAILLALVAALSLMFICGGCLYKGAKITEGTDIAVGLTVPGSEETVQLNVLNYLSGFRLGIAEHAALTLKYSCATTNSYFGVVHSETVKTIDATVEPCETDAPAATTNAVEEVASE